MQLQNRDPLAEKPGEKSGLAMAIEGIEATDQDRLTIEGFLAGDREAVQQVRSWIRLAAGRYRRFLANDLEDLEQETLTTLLVKLSSQHFRFASRLETYVSRITHYKCIDRLRARSRRTWVDLEELGLIAAERSAFEAIKSQQDREMAIRVVTSMTRSCQELWSMIRQGLSYLEMARRTGVAPGTLRVRVLRCRQKAIAERERLMASENPRGGNE